jgi:ABC-2 type transport system ATP-binding protein
MSLIIETKALNKTFKSGKTTVEAVKGIDLEVRQGEIFGFLGPNGAGKTTTLRMLATLVQPGGGQATIAGYDLQRDAAHVREHIGYVSQAGGTDHHSNSRENLIMQARLYGMSAAEAKRRTEEIIVALQLDTFANRIARTYSGGQRRRLDLGLGMIHRPSLLFLDEPTTGLDPQSRAHLWDEVRRLRDSGTTVFLTTHYMDEADSLCDRLAIMDDGRIVAEGTPDTLKKHIAGDIVTLGVNGARERASDLLRAQVFVREVNTAGKGLQLYVENGEENLPAILRLLDGEHIAISTLSLARPTLNDVFLRQTGRSLREAAN